MAAIKQVKRIVIIAVIVAAIAGIFIGINYSFQQKTGVRNKGAIKKIVVAGYAGQTAALLWIAEAQGYFAKNGLDVTIKSYEAGKLAADALLAGKADLATAAEFVFTSNSFNNPDLRIIGSIGTANHHELIARKDRGIEKPSDLKGKRIGATLKSSGEYFLGRFLTLHHLSIKDITLVDLTPTEMVKAISTGDIDACLIWEPYVSSIKSEAGDKVKGFPAQGGQDLYFLVIGRDNYIREHPEIVECFLRALVQAEHFVKTNKGVSRDILAKRLNYTTSYLQSVWQKHDFNVALPQALIVAMEEEARWMMRNKLIKNTTVPNYLSYIYMNGLKSVKPEAVTIIY